jgi:hypothetical protein
MNVSLVRDQFNLYRYYRRNPGFACVLPERDAGAPAAIDLATVSFNNAAVVQFQAKLLAKHLRDVYTYTVFDNSPPGPARNAIRAFCIDSGVSYVELPETPFAGNPGMHHGAALNWICRRHFAGRQSPYAGFLDHDIFPRRATSVVDRLGDAAMFGRIEERGDAWYLWPGFCFFSRERVRLDKLDFLPVGDLDTGGANWGKLYRRIDRASLPPLECSIDDLRPGGDKQADMIEYVGDWIHTLNASAWKPLHGKMALVERLLHDL